MLNNTSCKLDINPIRNISKFGDNYITGKFFDTENEYSIGVCLYEKGKVVSVEEIPIFNISPDDNGMLTTSETGIFICSNNLIVLYKNDNCLYTHMFVYSLDYKDNGAELCNYDIEVFGEFKDYFYNNNEIYLVCPGEEYKIIESVRVVNKKIMRSSEGVGKSFLLDRFKNMMIGRFL